MSDITVRTNGKGEVKVHYSVIKDIADHLRLEHNLPSTYDTLIKLNEIWCKGCDAECNAREKR